MSLPRLFERKSSERNADRNTAELRRGRVVVVAPNSVGAVCGVTDYAASVAGLLKNAIIWHPESRGGREEGSQVPQCSGLAEFVRLLLARPSCVVLNYTPFAYGRTPVQSFGSLVVGISRLVGLSVVVIWHEEPEGLRHAPGASAAVRRVLETFMARYSSAVATSTSSWAEWLRTNGSTRVVVVPIPSAFEDNDPLPSFAEREGIVIFGKNTPGKKMDLLLAQDTLNRVRESIAPLHLRATAVGTGWDQLEPVGVNVAGVAPRFEARELLASHRVGFIPAVVPVGAKSSTVAALLESGVPVVVTGHAYGRCQCCEYYQGTVKCVEADPVIAAQALQELLQDAALASSQSTEGVIWYRNNLSRGVLLDRLSTLEGIEHGGAYPLRASP